MDASDGFTGRLAPPDDGRLCSGIEETSHRPIALASTYESQQNTQLTLKPFLCLIGTVSRSYRVIYTYVCIHNVYIDMYIMCSTFFEKGISPTIGGK